jgi:hypothetical protein
MFEFSKNKKEVNQNHLKYLFYHFTITVQKLETFQIDSLLKCFNFLCLKPLQMIQTWIRNVSPYQTRLVTEHNVGHEFVILYLNLL